MDPCRASRLDGAAGGGRRVGGGQAWAGERAGAAGDCPGGERDRGAALLLGYYAEPVIGETFSYFTVFASIGLCALGAPRRSARLGPVAPPARRRWRSGRWARPSSSSSASSTAAPATRSALAMTRFSAQLPADNVDPALLRRLVLHARPQRHAADLPRRMALQRPAAAAGRLRALAVAVRLGRQPEPALPGARGGPAAALDRRPLGAAAWRHGSAGPRGPWC